MRTATKESTIHKSGLAPTERTKDSRQLNSHAICTHTVVEIYNVDIVVKANPEID